MKKKSIDDERTAINIAQNLCNFAVDRYVYFTCKYYGMTTGRDI